MAAIARTKRVTDPLDDKAKARIFGRDRLHPVYVSSGSEHSADNNNDEESPCLSNLLYGFLDEDAGGAQSPPPDNDSDSERDYSAYSTDGIEDLLNPKLLNESADAFRNVLLLQVSKAVEVLSFVKSNKSLLRRNVTAFLRSCGYNAAICKTKWESLGGLTAGSHEFIDVIRSDSGGRHSSRYFIDLEFAGEFEIARQTKQYECLLRTLPRVFVGRSENLKQIVKVISDAARRSLKSSGLHLPPWRKNRFMQNKWFSPYRRTVNLIPKKNSSSSLFTPAKETFTVKCRSVGFDAADGLSFFPATTRTR